MFCASDRKFSKTFIADFTFDIERERTRYPLYLNRNIMRVLDHHAKTSRIGARSSPVAGLNGASSRSSQIDLVTPPPRSTRLRDQLIEKFHQDDAELIFDVRSIRRKLNYRENLGERPKKRTRREAVECRCYFAVWDNREGHRQLEPILKRSVDCTVTPADATSDSHAAGIELEGPFRIPAREFFVPIRNRDGEISKWAIGDKYLLEIKIIPCKTSELWPPMPILSKSEDSLTLEFVKRKDLAFTEGMLIANYTNLPHAPPVDVPLNVAFDQGGRTFKTKYGLETNAEWTYPHIHEAKLKKEKEILAKRMEEEEATDPLCRSVERDLCVRNPMSNSTTTGGSLPVKAPVKVSYIWDIATKMALPRECRTTSIDGLHCPVCHIREFVDLRLLQFHLSNNHNKYRFSIEEQDRDLQTGKLKSVIFNVEEAEIVRVKAANHLQDEREFSWQRPLQPFEIGAYVAGDQSWVGALPRRRTAGAMAAAASQAAQVAEADRSAQATEAAGLKGLFRPTTEISEFPLPIRKKIQVPVAKTRKETSFYRTISHRIMETGELLSETDDDIDDDWLIKKHHDATAEMESLTEAEKRFRQRWNTHVMSEASPCSRYLYSSLIRFVRRNATWLRGNEADEGMFTQFQKLTSMLLERSLIDMRILRDCLRIIRDEPNPAMIHAFEPAEGSDRSLRVPMAAVNDRSGNSRYNQHEIPAPHPQGPGIRKQDYLGIQRESLPTPCASRHTEASPGGQKTAVSTPGPGQRRGHFDVAQQLPTWSQAKPLPHTVPTGFCGVCSKYIHRPKANAIMCSNLVSPVILHFHYLCFSLVMVQALVERDALSHHIVALLHPCLPLSRFFLVQSQTAIAILVLKPIKLYFVDTVHKMCFRPFFRQPKHILCQY